MTRVTTTYLELADPAALVPAKPAPPDTLLVRAVVPSPELARFFYTAVGGDFFWIDRLKWTWSEWHALLTRPGYELWYGTSAGTPFGFFELDGSDLPNVEIEMFGVLPTFVGRGLGGWLMEAALRRGLSLGRRVWLHTCSLDHPNALAAYRARGLAPYLVETAEVDLPPEPPGPWPGANRQTGRAA